MAEVTAGSSDGLVANTLIAHLRDKLANSELQDELAPLVEAAFRGPEAVEAVLRGEPLPATEDTNSGARQRKVFLSGIGAEGFRGIGPHTELQLEPGPGLTLVVGRNGSGKSSFAEGLEMLLTGANLRWVDRSAVWREGWRNLHQSETASVEARFHLEGDAEATEARRWWPTGASLDESETAIRLPGGYTGSLDLLDWQGSLDNHRPFLSYNELGSMLERGPADMHDAVSAFLGLDDGIAATEVLRKTRLGLEKPSKELSAATKALKERLGTIDDLRAQTALELVAKRPPDLDGLDQLIAGEDAGRETVAASQKALAALELPDAQRLENAAADLETALGAAADAVSTDAARARRLADLLRAARDHQHEDGTTTCPLCGTAAVLDDEWRARIDAEIVQLDDDAKQATELAGQVDQARRNARTAITPTPRALIENDAIDGAMQAAAAWRGWADTPETDVALAERLRSFEPVAELAATARSGARAKLDEHETVWRPVAVAIAAWATQAREAATASARAKQVKVAEDWMKTAVGEIRDGRFEPIADQARSLWGLLRHRSNVQLEQVALEGKANQRRVSLEVTVDGVACAALGVMSQGELHALALSLFLPRATMDESPFRFIVIDDPVQAMDPARVDGLARVLEQVSADRQVVVLTHDDRLPESVRRLGVAADVIEVTRQPGSVVSTRVAWDPVKTALDDAMAVASTKDMIDAAKCKVVPNYCRLAVEACAISLVRRRRLGRGDPHDRVEADLEAQSGLRELMALALFDDGDRRGDVNDELRTRDHAEATWVLGACNRGAHGDFEDDPKDLVRATERLTTWLGELS